ncbi:MAG: hypothetical protein WBB82_15725 [Limnothrix sp.]
MSLIPNVGNAKNVISGLRKHDKANFGVQQFFGQAIAEDTQLYINVTTLGELRLSLELICYRGDQLELGS